MRKEAPGTAKSAVRRWMPAVLTSWVLLSLLPGPNLFLLPLNMLLAAPFAWALRAARAATGGDPDVSALVIGLYAAHWLVPCAAALAYAAVAAATWLRRRVRPAHR